MTQVPRELDVRPILRAGGEPFTVIMDAVKELKPGQPLRLLATFEPIPLYSVLGKKGFGHTAQKLGDDDWEILFSPGATAASPVRSEPTGSNANGAMTREWPAPARHLDCRDLDPPEPLVRSLAAVEELLPGEVLSVLLCREPVFLLPKLSERGHKWQGGFEPDGKSFKLLVQKSIG